jgi:hypothetical protein
MSWFARPQCEQYINVGVNPEQSPLSFLILRGTGDDEDERVSRPKPLGSRGVSSRGIHLRLPFHLSSMCLYHQ